MGVQQPNTAALVEALRVSELRYRRLFESAQDGILILDAESGLIVDVNPFLITLLGFSREALLDKKVWELGFFKDIAANEAKFAELQAKDFVRYEDLPLETADGRKIAVEFVSNVYRVNHQRVIQCNIRDITARKRAELAVQGMLQLQTHAELARSHAELQTALNDLQRAHSELRATQMQLIDMEKMRMIGRLAAGVAHEVKNPLSVILRGIGYLGTMLGTQNAVAGAVLEDMRDAIARADSVIRGILDFAAPSQLTVKADNLNGVVEQALLFMKHEIQQRHVTVVKLLAPKLPPCQLDRPKMAEVFINLFENAIHAMPHGGVLTVRTSLSVFAAVEADPGGNKVERFKAGEAIVVAEVEDTGTGIPEEQLNKIFDPFFTTKPAGQGTGLGLSVAHTIVELHGGLIELANRSEGGARATITLKALPTMVEPASAVDRATMIKLAAYVLAEKNGFQGDTKKYWLQAEEEVDAKLGKK
jgi:PAS domain S-box-containing protein